MRAHFVSFFGSDLGPTAGTWGESNHPIKSWDVNTAMAMARVVAERRGIVPRAFMFTTKARNANQLDSRVVKRSGYYFLGGELLTLNDVKHEMPEEGMLISNMRRRAIKRVVVSNISCGLVEEFRDGDVLLGWDPKPAAGRPPRKSRKPARSRT